jgi:hypothetical protein
MERDIEKNPYTPDEQRVADYISGVTNNMIGAGDDPIAFLMASHSLLRKEHYTQKRELEIINKFLNKFGDMVDDLNKEGIELMEELNG